MKKLMAIALILTLLITNTPVASAHDNTPTRYSIVPTEGAPGINNVGSAEGHKTLRASLYLTDWHNQITESSSGQVKLKATSTASTTATKLEIYYTLQQWNGSAWITYSTYNHVKTGTSNTDFYFYKNVTPNTYYRVKTSHRAYSGSTIVDEETITSTYIYVD